MLAAAVLLAVAGLTACGPGGSGSAPGIGAPSAAAETARPAPVYALPAWPTGSPALTGFVGRIAFLAFDGVMSGAYVVDGPTGSIERLSDVDVDPVGIRWSPDGSSLAISRTICPPNPCGSVISILDVRTRSLRDITPLESGVVAGDPAFSPDGRRLVFRSNRRSGGDPFQNQLFIVDVDGRTITPVATGSTFSGAPAWSPDGGWIAYVEGRGFEPSRLVAVHPDGTELHVITEPAGLVDGLAWAPDGRSVAFRQGGPVEVDERGASVAFPELWRVSADGTDARPFFGAGIHAGTPSWATDGRSIAFLGGPPNERERLWIVSLDGGPTGVVPVGDLDPSSFDWTSTSGS